MSKLPTDFSKQEWDALSDVDKARAWARLEFVLEAIKPPIDRCIHDPSFLREWHALVVAIEDARKAAAEVVYSFRKTQGLPQK